MGSRCIMDKPESDELFEDAIRWAEPGILVAGHLTVEDCCELCKLEAEES